MELSTLGHATLVLSDAASGPPLLVTDPWIRGSCYWRSWWLERYPSERQIARISRAAYCYFTHEHPDHFHPPSIRRLGPGPEYLVPEFSRDMLGPYLRTHGFRARTVPAGKWLELTADVRLLSLPTLGNDSALFIDAPDALIANLNDARPTPDQLLLLRRVRHAVGATKRCILLASYSTAGIGHSMYRQNRRLDFVSGRHARYVVMLARALAADTYIPFASQVRFERPDTRWANAFRVSAEAVTSALAAAGVASLPPYVSLDLATGAHRSDPECAAEPRAAIDACVRDQLISEARALNVGDCQRLEHKLRSAGRAWLPGLFPRGLSFEMQDQRLRYDTIRGRVSVSDAPASLVFRLPAQALKDVLASGYFSDLCIPMFTQVHLGPETLPHAVYAFFVLMQLHDVGVTATPSAVGRTLRMSLTARARLVRAAVG